MDNFQNEDKILTKLLRNITVIFTLTVIPIAIVGKIVSHFKTDIQTSSMLFTFSLVGLTNNTILQLAGFSVVLAIFSTFLSSENYFKNIRFIWRIVFLFFATVISFYGFALIFNWLSLDEPIVWFIALLSIFICFNISVGLSLLKLKFEKKKYDKLLTNYKAKNRK